MSRGPASTGSSGGQGAAVAIVAVLIGALLGGIGGFAAGLVAFPWLFPAVPVGDVLEEPEMGPLRASGHFRHADPKDRLHWGSGSVSAYNGVLELGSDFEVGAGPRYHVYLVPLARLDADSPVEESLFVDLGPLKAFRGSQRYPIPLGVRLEDYGSVAIWCEQFNALISPADLELVTPVDGGPGQTSPGAVKEPT